MEGIFGTIDDYSDRVFLTPENLILPSGYGDFPYDSIIPSAHRIPGFQEEEGRRYQCSESASAIGQSQREGKKKYYYYDQDRDHLDATATDIKAKIASHPNYAKLLDAYIDCQKVGAPPEMAWFLDDIRREKDTCTPNTNTVALCLGMDPELDEFMETYYDTLVKLKADLSKPFDEATSFLNKIETQLGNLCKDDGGLSSDDELSGGESEVQDYGMKMEDRELKQSLLRRYGSGINSLKMEFSKKKKKGKLPKNARLTLLEWWNGHYKWPYPTEGDKIFLAESTGLDQKQINNWFINQRKRHWKPSENMHLAMMGNLAAEFLGEQ